MSIVNGEYESIFRINGKPILPPLITDKRRVELQRYKSLAIALENCRPKNTDLKRLESKCFQNVGNCIGNQNDLSFSTVKSGIDVIDDSVDRRDVVASVVEDNYVSKEKFQIDNAKFEANDSPMSLHLDINSTATTNAATDMLSPSFSLHSSPSLGALNDIKNQTLYFTPYSVPHSPDTEISTRKLIRSNSYTLDTPSPMLLELMEANGINASNKPLPPKTVISSSQPSLSTKHKIPAAKQTRPAAAATKIADTKSASMSDMKTSKVPTTRKSLSPSLSVREPPKKDTSKPKSTVVPKKCVSARNQESDLRAIYGFALTNRTISKPKKLSTAAGPAPTSGKLTARMEKPLQKPIAVPEPNAVEFQRILKMIEDQHSAQMNAMIERQKQEQKRMQEEFGRQQEMLVKHISSWAIPPPSTSDVSVSSSVCNLISRNSSICSANNNNDSVGGYDSTDDTSLTVGRDPNGNRMRRSRIDRKHPTPESLKCMRRLVYYDDNQMVSSDLSESNKQQHTIILPSFSLEEQELFRIQNDAATIITAYVKGYLTRRLFKTVKVQNIVKTIKDTLLFILDIHFENPIANDSPADLKLKTHLIQQLTSACYNLHNIFVNYSVTQRLDIIARDREWLEAKFNRSKSSDSFKSQQHKRMILNGHIPAARMEKMFL